MQTSIDIINNHFIVENHHDNELVNLKKLAQLAFTKIAPTWPLKNIIAVNPLKGFENKPFVEALNEGIRYFQQSAVPTEILQVNRETIKWCQSFFDEGQATINMPFRSQGFYQCFKQLARYDNRLKQSDITKKTFINTMPEIPEQAILLCLKRMNIDKYNYEKFFTLMLTTLPGWASYVCYQTCWIDSKKRTLPISQLDYLAVRIVLTYLIISNEFNLSAWIDANQSQHVTSVSTLLLSTIIRNETRYENQLITSLAKNKHHTKRPTIIPDAQLVFCIDVRSEPLRRAIESKGSYETFGFAGFFGVPVAIKQLLSKKFEASCPVLITPKHQVEEIFCCDASHKNHLIRKKRWLNLIKQTYEMLKYTFVTPFTLVETIGWWSGLWMIIRTVAPCTATRLKKQLIEYSVNKFTLKPDLNTTNVNIGIKLDDQCRYAENFLCMLGLTKQFAPIVVLCAHGANTQNNPYHSALDCGACGGRNGGTNAKILATILNDTRVQDKLAEKNIFIPKTTHFIAAIHDTTTDTITCFNDSHLKNNTIYKKLTLDLFAATEINNRSRLADLFAGKNNPRLIKKMAADWAQTRPEWGLARNAAMIVAPRSLTKQIDLDGRIFLHSYDWEIDQDSTHLTTILTAPMVVAQWINCQYLFSTLDNVAYGGGSKITQNICGKIGIMQGNASDLMPGLPLQSVNKSDYESYHEPLRLLTIVMAPRNRIADIIAKEAVLQNLFGNTWVKLACIDPIDHQIYLLTPNLDWQSYIGCHS